MTRQDVAQETEKWAEWAALASASDSDHFSISCARDILSSHPVLRSSECGAREEREGERRPEVRPSASAARIPISLKGYSGNAAGCAPRFARTTAWPEWKKQVIGRARAGTGLLQPLPPSLSLFFTFTTAVSRSRWVLGRKREARSLK